MKRHRIVLIVVVSLLAGHFEALFGADTLKIHLTYKHKLNPLGQTTGYITVVQKFFTPEDTLFREVFYNEATAQIDRYVFYFYNAGRLSTAEEYNSNDKLIRIRQYNHNGNSHLESIVEWTPHNDQMRITGKTTFGLNEEGNILHEKTSVEGKTVLTIKRKYNQNGQVVAEKVVRKPGAPSGNRKEFKSFAYGNGVLLELNTTGRDLSNKPFAFKDTYFYNDNRQLVSVKRFSSGILLSEDIYKYLRSGALSQHQQNNTDGLPVKLLQYEYKKHFMEKGTQVSFFQPDR